MDRRAAIRAIIEAEIWKQHINGHCARVAIFSDRDHKDRHFAEKYLIYDNT